MASTVQRSSDRPDLPWSTQRTHAAAPDCRSDDAAKAATSLFPLQLAPVEHCLLVQDRSSHPIQFFGRLRFSGPLKRQLLDKAYQSVLSRHPLLRSVVCKSGEDHLEWVPADPSLSRIHWLTQEPSETLPSSTFLDVSKVPGLRLTAVAGRRRTDLVAQFHHAACDGVGAFDFLSDLLTAYANELGEEKKRRRPLDPAKLLDRAMPGFTYWNLAKSLPRHLAGLAAVSRYTRHKPVPLVPHRPEYDSSTLPHNFPEGFFHHFSHDESAALRRVANRSRTTINSLLTRDLFMTLQKLRAREGLDGDDSWLRIDIPTSLRRVADRRMPVANVVSKVFLDRRAPDCQDAAELLRGIDRELEAMKRNQVGLMFSLVLRWLQMFPGSLRKTTRRDRCWATVLLTNLGPALANCHLPRRHGRLVIGGIVLEDVEFLPVLPAYQCVNFSVSIYAGRLTLGMNYDSRVLPAESARGVLDEYVGRILTSL